MRRSKTAPSTESSSLRSERQLSRARISPREPLGDSPGVEELLMDKSNWPFATCSHNEPSGDNVPRDHVFEWGYFGPG